jgi:hypothetical protein
MPPTENITREGIEVHHGQLWQDLNNRWTTPRICRVDYVDGGKAIMRNVDDGGNILHGDGVREVKISIRRMHNHSKGWALVSHGSE